MRPWLWLSPSLAHKLSPTVLNGIACLSNGAPEQWRPLEWRGLKFPNRLGVAGGVDKDALNVKAWWRLGAGFLEVGTITPQPQPGNPPPVVGRDTRQEALWNKLGFPSQGVERVKERLKALPRPHITPLFANIGKNATTSLDNAHNDYVTLLQQLRGCVDGFVVNISSPNTQGLRELLQPHRLRAFLRPLMEAKSYEPMLLKLSPDMQPEELSRVLEISFDMGIDGWILTNTSQGLRDGLAFPTEGGVSGRPLADRSKDFLKQALSMLGSKRDGKLVISVGGIMSAEDVHERLDMGADLVQVYSALIFQGPYFFRRVAKCQPARA